MLLGPSVCDLCSENPRILTGFFHHPCLPEKKGSCPYIARQMETATLQTDSAADLQYHLNNINQILRLRFLLQAPALWLPAVSDTVVDIISVFGSASFSLQHHLQACKLHFVCVYS
ncbi:Hypothetical predicted protein [Podarcis lilfordi]|uniref:Uncharacterized protein n=1 Tax=Podarcis lilfordi TaxID=74358 RepID=A0AA35KDL4_9SAUR|nr:Hypothetical predicted protein [Podarcis lilfordi]